MTPVSLPRASRQGLRWHSVTSQLLVMVAVAAIYAAALPVYFFTHAATADFARATALWLVGGVLLAWLGLRMVRRRVVEPLRALEAGLMRVAEGYLDTELPVHRNDELGRLTAHFNQMAGVLRGRAEEQGRFTAAGELLSGVAHEVSNPLMAIAAHAEARLAEPDIAPEQKAEMEQILRQAQRATKLLRGLVRFIRPGEREIAPVNLNDVARRALDVIAYRFGVDEITLGGRLDPTLPSVAGDQLRFEQVLVNLLANAVDALRDVKPPRRLAVDTWAAGQEVSVAVEDSGPGIAPDMKKRLFFPFASTKGRRGTGLGLYVSRQIALEAGGDLVLTPPRYGGRGARFQMTVPALAAPVAAPPEPARASGQGGLNGVRVLIVDDEESIRRPIAKFLARRGALVEEAGDGTAALATLDRQPADVILADLRMPRMGGAELYAQLEDTRPELAARVLFLSGDVSQLGEPGSTPVPMERVLVKPLELAQLERRLATFIQEVRGRGGRGGGGAGEWDEGTLG